MEKQGVYPPLEPGYPPQQPGYPPQQPGYPPQNPAYPPQQGYAQPPGYQPVAQGYGGQPQQPGMVIVSQPQTVVAAPREPMPSPAGSIILSCCIIWCCCWPLGCVAFIFAILGAMAKTRPDAVQKIGISYKISIAGLICGIILIIILVIYEVALAPKSSNTGY